MMAYPGQTRTTLGQLCAALLDSQSRPDEIQPGYALSVFVFMSFSLLSSHEVRVWPAGVDSFRKETFLPRWRQRKLNKQIKKWVL
jgi:hypothetical protein